MAEQRRRSGGRLPIALTAAVISVAGICAYANGLKGVFLFDDDDSIAGNGSIRRLATALHPPSGGGWTVAGRPILNLSLALNYAVGRTEVLGYHVANLGIHILAALILFGIVRRTALRQPERFWGGGSPASGALAAAGGLGSAGRLAWAWAAAAALIWVTHPLNSEAVTYIIQRAESLMGLFYLAALYAFIRAAEASDGAHSGSVAGGSRGWPSVGWFGLSVGSCLLGMGTKEVTVTLPVMILVFDRTFFAGSWSGALRRRAGYYAALAATWSWLAVLVVATGGNRGGSIGFGTAVSWGRYVLIQSEAIVRYLALSVWPHPLVFEYGNLLGRNPASFVPFALPVVALGLLTLYALWRRPFLGFLGFWFFGILAPTSLTPGTTQMIVEHRMYLPLAAVVVLAAWALIRWAGLRGLWVAAALACGLAALTARRNRDYSSALAMWSDTLAKRPSNAIASDNVGVALMKEGRLDEAIERLEATVRMEPGMVVGHSDLGNALDRAKRYSEAYEQFREGLRLNPQDAVVHSNYGMALLDGGRAGEAVAEFQQAVVFRPTLPQIHLNLGNALMRAGRFPEAIDAFHETLRLDPDNATAHASLGAALIQSGHQAEGLAELQTAVTMNPGDTALETNLGTGLAMAGRLPEARAHFLRALELDPTNTQARGNLDLMNQSGHSN